ncbi:tRNA (adenosine(37)-N6)-threonylcarbamoyltransferase complex ATPase subunit type 1 TsaE [Leptospira wolffii]|uniref:tRNA threonylcarbamoyladenosine biosynthesis protein TsaE n=1 Tax=Leptospira wolffii TaxID=409998 RepID=A0ABV5BI10_9LEPT|nr:tRNA (adenosine(37)-N6)-threonylcarbamoyltransferase complex ATPase subunit type 1 TsaE [Leptospira wolffii]TGL52774.1 tRNA (adenosine(37)-N6)-threonylcarbamoyltransferase complex ATPase subunit type 1 TsaE [Leptospira wolffii]
MQRQFKDLSLEELDIPAKVIAGLAGRVWKSGNYPILLLSGQMGAGKTTFSARIVFALLDFFGDPTDKKSIYINSPTYTILNEYPFALTKNDTGEPLTIYHFDLFRVGSEEEVGDLGFEEYWGTKGISLVEWWERAPSEFSNRKYTIRIRLEEEKEETRKIELELSGSEWKNEEYRSLLLSPLEQ